MSTRQLRRLEARERSKGRTLPPKIVAPDLTLVNPVSNEFATFIEGCAVVRRELEESVGGSDDFMVHEGSARGQSVVICGAGPSLRDTIRRYSGTHGALCVDQIWGCNSALPYLANNGLTVTHGFTVDQTPHMADEWKSVPDVEYLLATTVHPFLWEMLLANKRRMRFFHNFVGPNEQQLYRDLFPATKLLAGHGLNSVTRAINVAEYMGFDRITVLGADCALRVSKPRPAGDGDEYMRWLEESVEMHADGGNALRSGATAVTMEGEFDGRLWTTKPDMAITAVALVRMKRKLGDRLELVGDTLPNAWKDYDEEMLQRLPTLVDKYGRPA